MLAKIANDDAGALKNAVPGRFSRAARSYNSETVQPFARLPFLAQLRCLQTAGAHLGIVPPLFACTAASRMRTPN